MSDDLLRVYLDPSEIGHDGYPYAWRGIRSLYEANGPPPIWVTSTAIKDLVREQADNRCERCGHPYRKGNQLNSARSEWTPCDGLCTHGGPITDDPLNPYAQWRILTVHHLNGVKHDCRWWNLAALCQRCHLSIQGRVLMDRIYPWEHTDWFKPHAAGWYAWAYLGEELSREETMARLDELLDLERIP